MARDRASWGLISDHEHSVILRLMALPEGPHLCVSPVIHCTSSEPPMVGTLFSLILDALEYVSIALPPIQRPRSPALATTQERDESTSDELAASKATRPRSNVALVRSNIFTLLMADGRIRLLGRLKPILILQLLCSYHQTLCNYRTLLKS
jgi:hypothetical protein